MVTFVALVTTRWAAVKSRSRRTAFQVACAPAGGRQANPHRMPALSRAQVGRDVGRRVRRPTGAAEIGVVQHHSPIIRHAALNRQRQGRVGLVDVFVGERDGELDGDVPEWHWNWWRAWEASHSSPLRQQVSNMKLIWPRSKQWHVSLFVAWWSENDHWSFHLHLEQVGLKVKLDILHIKNAMRL